MFHRIFDNVSTVIKDHFVTNYYYYVEFFMVFCCGSDLVSPLEVDWVAVLSMLWPRSPLWPGSPPEPEPGHLCQLVSSWDTNVFNLSRYWLYNSTSLWPAPWNINCVLEHEIYQFYCSAAKVAIWEAIFCNDLMKVQVCAKLNSTIILLLEKKHN